MSGTKVYALPFGEQAHPLHKALRERILVLDGGMGTMIQTYGLTEEDYRGERFADAEVSLRGCNDLLPLTRPDVIEDIHRRYLAAGADILTACTFTANPLSLAEYGLAECATEINLAAVRAARRAADEQNLRNPSRRRLVGGSVGPTGRSASLASGADDPAGRSVTFAELAASYQVQIEALIRGGADLIQLETFFDTLNAKAALLAARRTMNRLGTALPVMVSGTLTASGRTLSGQTVEAFYVSVAPYGPATVGFNCSFGARQLRPHVEALAAVSDYPIAVYPNAGLPAADGGYQGTPQEMAEQMEEYMRDGLVNIVGGCCGTTPAHIALLAETARRHSPRPIPPPKRRLRLAGTEPVAAPRQGPLLIGERANVAGSARFARMIREGRREEAAGTIRAQKEAGASVADVCMDDASLDAPDSMRRFLLTAAADPTACSVAVMIDSSAWNTIEAGLQCIQGRPIINSISLKEGEAEFLRRSRVARDYGAAAVVMLFDEKGQADTYERKIEVARRSYDLLAADGFPPQDIVFDPNVLAIATGMEQHDRYALDFIRACRWIKENLPGASVSAGVSNLSFALRGANRVREALHSVFLHHAAAAGLDMAIVNPSALVPYDQLEGRARELAEDAVLARRPDAAQRLVEYAALERSRAQSGKEKARPADEAAAQQQWRSLPPAERLRHAMLEGIADHVADDARQAAEGADALTVIETAFMPAMEQVGRLFAEGRMFLPQIVRAARVMKLGVDAIMPRPGGTNDPRTESGGAGNEPDDPAAGAAQAAEGKKILVATVRGDVHDIGKNIASVVMRCNGYRVRDLGVMIPAADIADAAISWEADAAGLSALITPSLEEMAQTLREMDKRGLRIPVLIAGATTSAEHTALWLAPLYGGPVIHAADASDNAAILGKLFGPQREKFLGDLRTAQAALRDATAHPHTPIPLADARRRARVKSPQDATPAARCAVEYYDDYPADRVAELIDWNFFFSSWELKGRWPEILRSPEKGPQARRLHDDAMRMLDEIVQHRRLTLCGAVGVFPARRCGDDILVTSPQGEEIAFPMLRRQSADGPTLSAADFVAPQGDHIGAFAVSAGVGLARWTEQLKADGDDYGAIMAKLLSDRLTEAMAEKLHSRLRRHLWGYETGPEPSASDIIAGRYRGIRLAFGYPATPDHSLKVETFRLLGVEGRLPLSLTDNYMISPGESLCGLMFASETDSYFAVGPIGADQAQDYARRRAMPLSTVEKLLPKNIRSK